MYSTDAKRKRIQTQLMSKLGIIFKIVKRAIVYGISEILSGDFLFWNPSIVHFVNDIDETFIRRFAAILEMINSGNQRINISKFTTYAKVTSALNVKLLSLEFHDQHSTQNIDIYLRNSGIVSSLNWFTFALRRAQKETIKPSESTKV